MIQEFSLARDLGRRGVVVEEGSRKEGKVQSRATPVRQDLKEEQVQEKEEHVR